MIALLILLTTLCLSVAAAADGPVVDSAGGTEPKLKGESEVLSIPGLRTQVVDRKTLSTLQSAGRYLPVPGEKLSEVARAAVATVSEPQEKSLRIREAAYRATLDGSQLTEGALQLTVFPPAADAQEQPLLLGSTNLGSLSIHQGNTELPIGADNNRRLFLLKSRISGKLTGSWSAEGAVTGDTVTFRLDLPQAAFSRLELTTTHEIIVSSNKGLVLDPEEKGDRLVWTILPTIASRLTFSCRTRRIPQSSAPLPLKAMSAEHRISAAGESLVSRWLISLPDDLQGVDTLISRIHSSSRITAVRLNESLPLKWASDSDQDVQQLTISLPPDSAAAGRISVHAETPLPPADGWLLPILVPAAWERAVPAASGSLLFPVSQISLRVPSVLNVDGLSLEGIQERDVITDEHGGRVYQLVQYSASASARLFTSVSEPVLTNSLVTVLESSGRLVTARCFFNVTCRQAPAIRLQWLISRGWDVVSAKYASDGRSLFFEFPRTESDKPAEVLTVCLPEVLEEQSSRVIEVQLQSSEVNNSRLGTLPSANDSAVEPQSRFLIVSSSFRQLPNYEDIRGPGRQAVTAATLLTEQPWVPASLLSDDSSEFYQLNDTGADTEPAVSAPSTLTAELFDVTYSANVRGDLLLERTEISVPAGASVRKPLRFLVAAGTLVEPQWTVNGAAAEFEKITPVSDTSESGLMAGWEIWSASEAMISTAGSGAVIACEAARPSSESFTAGVAYPEIRGTFRGHMELSGPAGLQLTAEGLAEDPAATPPAVGGLQIRTYRLPGVPSFVSIKSDTLRESGSRRMIESHVLHHLQELQSGVKQHVLAAAAVHGIGDGTLLRLNLPAGILPLASVDGRRVQLVSIPEGVSVPLPAGRAECRVVLTWSRLVPCGSLVSSVTDLHSVFQDSFAFQQSTHHLLLSPGLRLADPRVRWITSNASAAEDSLRQLKLRPQESDRAAEAGSPQMLPDVRVFLSQWQLAAAQNWAHHTMSGSMSAVGDAPEVISVSLTPMSGRRLVQYLSLMVTVLCCMPFLNGIRGHQRLTASLCLVPAVLRMSASSADLDAVLCGTFWGLIFVLVLAFSGRRLVPSLRSVQNDLQTASLILAICISTAGPAVAQVGPEALPGSPESPQSQPDVLIPDQSLPDSGIVYVSEPLFRLWQSTVTPQSVRGEAVVTSSDIRMTLNPGNSVEALLTLEVAAVSDDSPSEIRIPLQDSQLVECLVDGRPILPAAASTPDRTIIVSLPTSVIVPPKPLAEISAGAEVAEGPPPAWRTLRVECRLRPRISRQPSGMRFRLPSLACHGGSFSVECPAAPAGRVLLQSGSVVREWTPETGNAPVSIPLMSDGVDVRVYSGDFADVPPATPQVNSLTICETLAGQQVLTTLCRISHWNPLNNSIRLQIPAGYRLTAVSSPEYSEVYWSVKGNSAEIRLNSPAVGKQEQSPELQFRMQAETPVPPLQNIVPTSALAQLDGCLHAPSMLVAVRTTSEFSVQQNHPDSRSPVAFSEVPEEFRRILLKTDVIYQLPTGSADTVFRLAPREPESEVRVSQFVRCSDLGVDWTYEADIETSGLPLFRHRMTIDSSIRILDVRVLAGEADRLDKHYQHGDQLILLLKEGTSGPHRLTIRGRQNLNETDTEFRLPCPRLQNVDILESSLTITDESTFGCVVEETGGTRPDRRLRESRILVPGEPLRFQVVDETDPIVIRRRRAAPREGRVALIREGELITVLLQVSRFPGDADSARLSLPSDLQFTAPPKVSLDGQLVSGAMNENTLTWSSDSKSEAVQQFSAMWTVPVSAASLESSGLPKGALPLPLLNFDVRWKESLAAESGSDSNQPLNQADPEEPGSENAVRSPAWVTEALRDLGVAEPQVDLNFRAVEVRQADSGDYIMPPEPSPVPISPEKVLPVITVVANTNAVAVPQESAMAETMFVVFSSRTPSRLTFHIPEETVLLQVSLPGTVRSEYAGRSLLSVDLSEPVTTIRIRWLSGPSTAELLSTRTRLRPPCPQDCPLVHLVTFQSHTRGRISADTRGPSLNQGEFDARLTALLADGFRILGRIESVSRAASPGTVRTQVGSADSSTPDEESALLLTELSNAGRQLFAEQPSSDPSGLLHFDDGWSIMHSSDHLGSEQSPEVDARDLRSGPAEVIISERRLPAPESVLPYAAAFLLMAYVFVRGSAALPDISGKASLPIPSVPAAEADVAITRVAHHDDSSDSGSIGFTLSSNSSASS